MKWRDRKGFTLVEVVITVAIIGIVAAKATQNAMRVREEARETKCLANIRNLQSALDMARMDSGYIGSNKTAAQLEATLVPAYMKPMPECNSGGVYSTDADSVVHCDVHAP